jgi:DNA polymerase III epsilon subunit-like protein
MTVVFSDTETTGLDPIDSAPYELAFLIYKDGQLVAEREFHCNPLNEEVVIHPDAIEVNGATEEQIRSYPPAKEVVPEIVKYLNEHIPPEKFVFAGYNCPFDYGHLGALLFREGFNIGDYFNGRMIDCYVLVQKASEIGLLPKTINKKLETITKALGIPHEDKHSAMGDIRATRTLYEHIYHLSRRSKL